MAAVTAVSEDIVNPAIPPLLWQLPRVYYKKYISKNTKISMNFLVFRILQNSFTILLISFTQNLSYEIRPATLRSMMSGEHKTVIKGNTSKYVKLNVGGSLHYTTLGTLTKQDTMLRAMFSGRMEVLTDSEDWILIDRCGKHFGTILNFLRDGFVPLPELRRDLLELLQESKYYLVQELSAQIDAALTKKEDMEPACQVPLLTSSREEQQMVMNSTKPVVKLICNRHNNKYSYTSNSDDNLLKNLELFDKLSLRFKDRILFLKDVIGHNEICLWSFYGHGNKIAEVCCTSIVYGSDKKNTKVEFPEARIYEDTLNLLLYENRDKGPDVELLQATSGKTVGVSGYHSDEDMDEKLDRVDRLRRK